jgi:hypothetical protein
VRYAFIVTNTGDQALEISNVAPGCHCTTAGNWTHHLEPGQTGQIPLQFDSGSFRGDVTKAITVTSNDKLAPRQNIYLHGSVWHQVDISPQMAYMNVPADATNATCVVHINIQGDEPVTISAPASISGSFKGELKTIKPGKEFELVVTAIPPLPTGNMVGRITLKTSLTNLPELSITTYASVQAAVTAIPPQIILPQQSAVWLTNIVTVDNHQNAPLTLSGAQICCDPRASIQIKTNVPGRRFQLVVAIPPDFSTNGERQAQVTVNTDSASQPSITVPIQRNFHTPHFPTPRPMTPNPVASHP